jgi:hypothetical protein
MKSKLKKFALVIIIAPLAPVAGLLGFWWTSYALLPEKWIPLFTIGGFLLGLLADIFILKQLIPRADKMPTIFWMVIFLFYTVGVFGFFMGVPVFNALLAIPAGFVVGARLAAENADRTRVRKAARGATWFTTGILFLVCAASAFIALVSPSTPNDLRGMLGLGFDVTQAMVIGLIVVGGILLLAFNAVLTAASIRLTHSFLTREK